VRNVFKNNRAFFSKFVLRHRRGASFRNVFKRGKPCVNAYGVFYGELCRAFMRFRRFTHMERLARGEIK